MPDADERTFLDALVEHTDRVAGRALRADHLVRRVRAPRFAGVVERGLT